MERAAGGVVLPLLFEFYARIDNIDNIGARYNIINKASWNSSGHREV